MSVLLDDDRIYIRPYVYEDVALLSKAVRGSLVELLPWINWVHLDYTDKDALDWVSTRQDSWQRGCEYDFAIFCKKTDCLLGGVGLNAIFYEHRFANMGYWVCTAETGKGIATAAARLLCRFAFEYKSFNRVEIVASSANLGSQRVAEKIPAQREGILRERSMINGELHDTVMYSVLASQW